METEGGVTQAIYPEGGLSRDGRLQPARLGLLSYMVRAFDVTGTSDIVFVPVGINYDRVLEDRTLLGLAGTAHRGPPRAAGAIRFLGGQLSLALRGKWFRFGYAAVGFGRPISLRQYTGDNEVDWTDSARYRGSIETLGEHLLGAVGQFIPVLPVALVATVFAAHKEPMDALDLKRRVAASMDDLESRGVYVHVPRADRDYAIEVGLRM
jgi:glycerol-3-phosphate O-acyltransferase